MSEEHKALLTMFLVSAFSVMLAIVARMGVKLGGDLPPDDPVAFKAWRRKTLWIIVAEVATIPAMAAGLTAAAAHWGWSIIYVVIVSMVCGAAGFGVLIDAAQRVILRRAGNA